MTIDANAMIAAGGALAGALCELIVRAIESRDVSTLRRVSDVLPGGHPLRSRIALIAAEWEAEKELCRAQGTGCEDQ